jgi:uncharacterized alkaline shock family protein YloU
MTDATRPQPATIDLGGIDRSHPGGESTLHLVGTTVAETAAAVTGVHHLGGVAARTLDRARRAVLGTSTSPGVTVASADGVTTVDLDLVVEYPHPVVAVVEETRRQVILAASPLSFEPVEVNITVTDVHGPFDTDPVEVLDSAVVSASAAATAATDSVKETAGRAAGVARDAADRAQEAAGRASDTTQDALGRASETARAAADAAAVAAHDAADAARDAATAADRAASDS